MSQKESMAFVRTTNSFEEHPCIILALGKRILAIYYELGI